MDLGAARHFPFRTERIRLAAVTDTMKTFDLLGTPLVATSYDELTAHVHDLARSGAVPRSTSPTRTSSRFAGTIRIFAKSPAGLIISCPTECPSSGA
jgi:hypothetical protein